MRRVSTAALVSGMITVEDVYNYKGSLILPKGLVLTDKAITKLEYYSIMSIRVEDELAVISEEDAVEETSYSERLKQTQEFQQFEANFHQGTEAIKDIINNSLEDISSLDVEQLVQHTVSLLSTEGNHVNVFDMLHSMRQLDDSTYAHSMNVGLICNILAHWLRMDEESIKLATICGLLHDIGKLKISEKILKKPGRLTQWEYSVIQTHPREGYNLLQNCPVDDHVKNAALMHHERCDGSGYPLKLTAAQIDPFAKLVAIADVYDAMTLSTYLPLWKTL